MTFFHDVARYAFLQNAIAAGALAALACGIVGSYVVVRRTTYSAGAISHCILGGMGAARYLQRVHGLDSCTPLVGATVAAVLAALLIAAITLRGRQRVDTVLSAIWAVGMAIGISFIAATPGYQDDLMSYLFGNILMVTGRDLALMAVLDVVVVGAVCLFHGKLLAIGFNEELARLRGIPVALYEVLFLVVTALTVVLLAQVVGVVLVIALLTLPAATAGHFTRRLGSMLLLAVAFSFLFTVGGLALSYAPELPAGATIIELAGAAYLGTLVWARIRRPT